MKATLEFTLPEDQEEFTHATRGVEYFTALREIREWLRGWRKHGELTEATTLTMEAVWDKFHETCEGLDV